MKNLIVTLLFFFTSQSVYSSIVYNLDGSNVIESICQDGKSNHQIEANNGLILKLEGHGDKLYEYPTLHQSIPNTSTDGVKKFPCTYEKLDSKESNFYLEKIKKVK